VAAPTIYRSTDANAPILTASPGSVVALLNACLVNGYGSVKATATITSSGTTVANNDTITIDGVTYTWKTALTPAAGEVLIGASAATNLSNLAAAIGQWGTSGTNYGAGTTLQTNVQVTALTTTVLTLTALKGGTGGNSIAISKSAANITLSGATLAGGSGTDTTASLGWTAPFTTANGAAYRAAAGLRMYVQVLDNASGTGLSRDALTYGWETMSAWNTGTGEFPTTAQVATVGAVIRKCGATADSTNKPWFLIGDDRTFYLFILTGDSAGVYVGYSFGEFYSYVASDPFKCQIQGFTSSGTAAITTNHPFGLVFCNVNSGIGAGNAYLPRNYSGLGASTAFLKLGDAGLLPSIANNAGANTPGNLGFPNPSDGGLYLCPLRMVDGSTPATTVSGTINLRGRMRGLYQICHAASFYADGDTVNGTGAYAGRSFMVVKNLLGSTTASMIMVETTAWDTSA